MVHVLTCQVIILEVNIDVYYLSPPFKNCDVYVSVCTCHIGLGSEGIGPLEMKFQAVVDWMDIATAFRTPVQSSGGAVRVSIH